MTGLASNCLLFQTFIYHTRHILYMDTTKFVDGTNGLSGSPSESKQNVKRYLKDVAEKGKEMQKVLWVPVTTASEELGIGSQSIRLILNGLVDEGYAEAGNQGQKKVYRLKGGQPS